MLRNAVLILLVAFTMTAQARAPQGGPQDVFSVPHLEAQLIVGLAPGVAPTVATNVLSPFDAVELATGSAGNVVVVGIDADANLGSAVALAIGDPRVEFIEPNYVYSVDATPNDLDFSRQWAKRNTGVNAPSGLGTPGADLNMTEAWDVATGATGVVVAIIDDGVETTHIDLAGNISPNGKCFASPNSARPCSNGTDDPNPADGNDFHGTLVAGTAGAVGNNGIGIAGTAWAVTLLPLKVDLSSFAIAEAIDEAIARQADIVNMSFGGPVQSTAVSQSLERAEAAGMLAIAAAGNADADNGNASHYPSDSRQPNVIGVAATTANDEIAGFSQWGAATVDVAAPGELIRTTAVGNMFALASGTSFAAPHVAGVAALVQSATGASDYRQVKAHLIYSGVGGVTATGPVVPGANHEAVPGRVASGRLDAARAIDGPPDAVLVIDGVVIDDSATGNGNARLDPGESANLIVSIRNVWTTAAGVTASLVSPEADSAVTVNDFAPVLVGDVARDSSVEARFSVTLDPAAAGNRQTFLQLDLGSTAGTLPSRYFYLETGALGNGISVAGQLQRWNWDEFHAYHVDIPAGTSQLTVSTSATGDIDLLVRHNRPPQYLITLNAQQRGVQGFYYVDSDTVVSAGEGAGESVTIDAPLPGTWHVVIVNYDQQPKNYEVQALHSAPGADLIAFSSASYNTVEGAGVATITVTRSGGPGSASVEYLSSDGSATAPDDYANTSGVLNWGAGESGERTFTIEVADDASSESTESVLVSLRNAAGAMLGAPSSAELLIADNDGADVTRVQFAQAAYSVNEPGGNVTLSVTRTGRADAPSSVDYVIRALNATADVDYGATGGSLSWPAGDLQPKTLVVAVIDDTIAEGVERFQVDLAHASGAILGTPASATVSIIDNDSSPPASGGGGGGTVGIELLLTVLLFLARRGQAARPGIVAVLRRV